MISNFFSKSKPIHFLVLSCFMLLSFLLAQFYLGNTSTFQGLIKKTLLFGACFFSILVFDFFTSKNELTQKSSYRTLFYVLFMAMIPEVYINSSVVLSNLFLLLAFRRILSFRSKKRMKKKLFDAAFWLSLATLLYFWSGLFFILIFAALYLYRVIDIKNWIIPLVGILSVVVLTIAILVFLNSDVITFFSQRYVGVSLDFSNLNSKRIIIASTLIVTYFIWSTFYYLKNIKTKSKSYKPSYLLVHLATAIAFVIVLIAPNKTGAEFLFLFAPLSIVLTNYIEVMREKWFKEVLIWVLILMPVIGLVL